MKKFSTPKLFYQKYPYKILWKSPLATYFRGSDLTYAREMLDHCQQQLEENGRIIINGWRNNFIVSREDLFGAHRVYSALSTTDAEYQLRIEGSSFVIYSSDREWLYNLGNYIGASEWWEPTCTLEPNTIIMGPLMQGWGYKITLGGKIPKDFYTWVTNNTHKLKIGNTLLKCISKNYTYLDGYYFYVKDEKMLNLVSLVLGSGVRRVDKILVEDENA